MTVHNYILFVSVLIACTYCVLYIQVQVRKFNRASTTPALNPISDSADPAVHYSYAIPVKSKIVVLEGGWHTVAVRICSGANDVVHAKVEGTLAFRNPCTCILL